MESFPNILGDEVDEELPPTKLRIDMASNCLLKSLVLVDTEEEEEEVSPELTDAAPELRW